ncbi:MAG TPA: endonuclease domain-containing protein [Polyangiaceae bacterium]
MVRRSQPSTLIQLRARQHRSALTASEELLWQHIRGHRLGVYFRRQVVIRHFIVDFLAPSARLIVEVDGGYHLTRRSADARRDSKLHRLGYRVLRLSADLVSSDAHAAVELIRSALAE